MKRPKRAGKLSAGVSVVLLVSALGIVGGVEWNALLAKETRDNPPHQLNLAYCTSCHADARTLAKMRWKEGSTHFLFPNNPRDRHGNKAKP